MLSDFIQLQFFQNSDFFNVKISSFQKIWLFQIFFRVSRRTGPDSSTILKKKIESSTIELGFVFKLSEKRR